MNILPLLQLEKNQQFFSSLYCWRWHHPRRQAILPDVKKLSKVMSKKKSVRLQSQLHVDDRHIFSTEELAGTINNSPHLRKAGTYKRIGLN